MSTSRATLRLRRTLEEAGERRSKIPTRRIRCSSSFFPSPFPSMNVLTSSLSIFHSVLEYPLERKAGETSVSLTYGDVKRLGEDEFLNDTLIEFGLKHVSQSSVLLLIFPCRDLLTSRRL